MKFFAPLFLAILVSACSHLDKIDKPSQKVSFFTMSWAKNLDPEYVSGNLPIGVGAPRIFDDILYQGTLSGQMLAMDAETGRVLWKKDEKAALGAPVARFGESVAYGSETGRLFVRHYLTGELKYAIDLSSPIESAPVFTSGRLLIYLRGHQIVSLDAETGKVLWSYKRAVPVTTTLQRTTKPLVLDQKVILGFADGFIGALSLQDGSVLWETKIVDNAKFVDVDLNPVLAGSMIVTGSPSGELMGVNPQTGAVAMNFGVSVMSHPYLKGQQILVGTNDGDIVLLSLAGEKLKTIKISKQPVSAVTWWKDHIVAASFDGKLRAIDPLTSKIVDTFAMGYSYSSVFSDLITTEDYLTIYSSRNHLYVFR